MMSRIILLVLATTLVISACTSGGSENASCGRVIRNPPDYSNPLDQCYIHTFSNAGAVKRVIVYYADIPEVDTDPRDGINDWAVKVGKWTAAAWTAFTEYGFRSPVRTTDDRGVEEVEVWLYPRNRIGTVNSQAILVAAETINDREEIHEQVIHELFHATQGNHLSGSGYPGWFTEGTAQVMQDHTDAMIDTRTNGFSGCANIYLATAEEDVTTRPNECATALWWKYFMEQLDKDPREPVGGAEVLASFMNFLSPPSSPADFLDQLDAFIRNNTSSNQSLENMWCNFAVANYVKDLSGSGIQPIYRYVDEMQPPGPYDADDNPATPPVKLHQDFTLTVRGEGAIADGLQLPAWAVRYYRVRPAPNISPIEINFSSGQSACFSLLIIDDEDLVNEFREVGRGMHRTIENLEFDEVVVVVATLKNSAEYGFSIMAR